MKSLKKKFGKFAISQEKSAKVNGGWGTYPPNHPCYCPKDMLCKYEPWCDNV